MKSNIQTQIYKWINNQKKDLITVAQFSSKFPELSNSDFIPAMKSSEGWEYIVGRKGQPTRIVREESPARVNFQVKLRVKYQLERICQKSNADNMTEAFRRAIAMYEALLDIRAKGGKIKVHHKGGEVETLFMVDL